MVTGLLVRTDQGQAAPFVTSVNPRPRLMFAPGEYQRFVGEIAGVRRVSFERLASEIDTRGTKAWNERDIQLESQALAARVLLDRGDARGERYLGYARRSVASLLDTHTFTNWRDSHDIVTEGGRWIEAMSFAHDWLHDRWTPDERQRMAVWLDEEVDDWVGGNRLARASASPFRNDAARGTAALVLAGLTLFDEPGHEDAGRRALAHAQPYYEAMTAAHAYAGAGGGMAEGTFYGNFTAWAQTLVAEALYTGAGVPDAYTRTPFYLARLQATRPSRPGRAILTNQFGYNVHQLAPVFGDAGGARPARRSYHRATVLLLGKRFADRAAARAAYWAVNREETSRTYTPEWALYDVLLLVVRGRAGEAVRPGLPRDHARAGLRAIRLDRRCRVDEFQRRARTSTRTSTTTPATSPSSSARIWSSTAAASTGSDRATGSTTTRGRSAHNTITVTDPAERWRGHLERRSRRSRGERRRSAHGRAVDPAPTLDEYLANRTAYDQGRIVSYGRARGGVYVRADLTNAYQNPAYPVVAARRGEERGQGDARRSAKSCTCARAAAPATRSSCSTASSRPTPRFRKAVLWHAREPFAPIPAPGGSAAPGATPVSEGETRYAGASRYDFTTDVAFDEGAQRNRARLFVSVLAVDPVVVREIGRRPSTPGADHTTFGVAHHHRHVQDYLVEDPRGLTNGDSTLGTAGQPEWPPFNPPEQQWLWTDDLVGGWGQTRLQIEPDQARAADRFLTVLVPADADGNRPSPDIRPGRPVDGTAAGVVLHDGSRTDVVMFGADPHGGELTQWRRRRIARVLVRHAHGGVARAGRTLRRTHRWRRRRAADRRVARRRGGARRRRRRGRPREARPAAAPEVRRRHPRSGERCVIVGCDLDGLDRPGDHDGRGRRHRGSGTGGSLRHQASGAGDDRGDRARRRGAVGAPGRPDDSLR